MPWLKSQGVASAFESLYNRQAGEDLQLNRPVVLAAESEQRKEEEKTRKDSEVSE